MREEKLRVKEKGSCIGVKEKMITVWDWEENEEEREK